MSTAKEELTRLIQGQPEDSSREEIVRELAFHLMVERPIYGIVAQCARAAGNYAHRARASYFFGYSSGTAASGESTRNVKLSCR